VGGSKLDQDMIGVTVTNIGTAPTTIESLFVEPNRPKFFGRVKEDISVNYYILDLQIMPASEYLPKQLNPGDKWQGFIRMDEDAPNFRNGNFWACISSTMHRKDLRAKIPRT